jgi:hypothetical protein
MSILAYGVGILKIVYPSVPDGSGRWGWLTRAIYENLGVYGLAGWWGVIGTVLLAAYFSSRRADSR